MKLIEKIQEVLGILNFSNILTSKSSLLGLPSFLRPESPPTTPPGPEEPFGGVGECAQSHGEGAGFTEFRAFGNHEKMSGKGDRDGDRSCLEPRDWKGYLGWLVIRHRGDSGSGCMIFLPGESGFHLAQNPEKSGFGDTHHSKLRGGWRWMGEPLLGNWGSLQCNYDLFDFLEHPRSHLILVVMDGEGNMVVTFGFQVRYTM